MLALSDPSIDTSQMFNVLWYVIEKMENRGYSEEDLDDAMAANTRARIEMETPWTLKSALQPNPSCVARFQAYVLSEIKSRMSIRKQRGEQCTMMQHVLTTAV